MVLLANPILILLILPAIFQFGNTWREDRRPRLLGDKIPFKSILPSYHRNIQRRIVFFHNFFRTRVIPSGANMLRMTWHKGAAKAAQRWSQKCMFLTHDNVTGRHIDNYGACGQNIFIATQKVPWLFAIKTWFLERNNFTYGSVENDLKVIGHYTQMVWASTHKVGCGLATCSRNGDVKGKKYYSYVCNYCPIGNREEQLGWPYKRGKPCRMCKRRCHAQKLCTNACNVADLWANCKELYRTWPNWLCHNRDTPMGMERAQHCRATCTCRNKIYD